MSGNAATYEAIGVIRSEHVAAKFDCIEGTRNGWQDAVDEVTSERRGRREYRGGGSDS